MIVKTQHYLQPTIQEAHSVIVEDAAGHVIYIAIQAGDAILAAQAGDESFAELSKAVGLDKTTIVHKIRPKSLQEMKRLL